MMYVNLQIKDFCNFTVQNIICIKLFDIQTTNTAESSAFFIGEIT